MRGNRLDAVRNPHAFRPAGKGSPVQKFFARISLVWAVGGIRAESAQSTKGPRTRFSVFPTGRGRGALDRKTRRSPATTAIRRRVGGNSIRKFQGLEHRISGPLQVKPDRAAGVRRDLRSAFLDRRVACLIAAPMNRRLSRQRRREYDPRCGESGCETVALVSARSEVGKLRRRGCCSDPFERIRGDCGRRGALGRNRDSGSDLGKQDFRVGDRQA